jgi:hypothetical protein
MLALACLIIPVWAIAAPVGTITHVEGTVDLTAVGKAAREVFKEEPVSEGDILRAKSHSKAEVTFTDGNILRLAENTRVKISSYQIREGKQIFVDLSRGKVQSIVKNLLKNSRYEVHTPTAVCGVRGTDFFVFFQSGVSGASPREGTIYVYNPKFPATVATVTVGQEAIIGNTDQTPVLQPTSETDMNNHLKDTSPAEQPPLTDETTPQRDTLLQPPLLNTGESLSQINYFNETTPGAPPVIPNNDIIDNGVNGGVFVTNIDLFTQTLTSAVSGRLSISTANDLYIYANIIDYQQPAIGGIDGLMTDGTRLTGYIGGIPGSWSGLFRSVYLQGQNVGYATGDLSGGFSGRIITARGMFTMNSTLGLADSPLESFTLLMPVFENIDTSGGIIQTPPSLTVGYKTSTGSIVSVWGLLNPTSTYKNDGASSLTCGTSGTSTFTGSLFYMLGSSSLSEHLMDQKYKVMLDGNVQYLDTAYLGSIDLSYRGTYSQAINTSGQHSGANIGAGTYTLNPLDFSSSIDNSFTYQATNNGTNWSFSQNNFEGLMGGIGTWWTSGTSDLYFMGKMSFSSSITVSPVFQAEMNMTNSSGAYLTLLGGIKDSTNSISGFMQGIYMKANNKVGIIYSTDTSENETISGTYYPGLGMWQASGTAYTYAMGTIDTISNPKWILSNFVSELSQQQSPSSYNFGVPGLEDDSQSTMNYLGEIDRVQYDFGILGPTGTGSLFGIWSSVMGGSYNTIANPGGYWNWSINDPPTAPTTPPTSPSEYISILFTPATDTSNALIGNYASGIVNWTSAQTFVAGGVIKGTFDPTTPSTWNVVGAGTFMETKTFLDTVNVMTDTQKAAFEQATKIPAFEVGSVNLAGSGKYGTDTLFVSMSNVQFFQFSTDSNNPRIWASENVNGQFGDVTGTTPPVGTTASLNSTSGGTFSNVLFTVQKWGNNQWGATVNGSGSVTTTTTAGKAYVAIKGGAAGTYTLPTTTSPTGLFTGTGSGSSRPNGI